MRFFVYTNNNMGVKDVVTGRLLGSTPKFSDKQIAETVQLLVQHGVKRGANTVHLEPHDRFVLVRYRIDGTLRGIHKLPRVALEPLLKQLKFLADLSPEVHDMPQEGQYAAELGDETVSVRVTIMPVLGGEKAVLHLSRTVEATPASLEALHFWGDALEAVTNALAHPHGLITVAGTKHSGKSSTLYALLRLLHNPAHSIATVEEHATQRLPGTAQTYVHSGDIENTLRAVLGQDPDIIMLGNLPNRATAELAIHSATTGHLILTELHAESAPASLAHLRAMGIEPFLLASAWKLSIGQRLVRRLCPACRERYQPSPEESEQLAKTLSLSRTAYPKINQLEQKAKAAGFGADAPLSSTTSGIAYLWRPHAGGCSVCDRTGYQGRLGLTEVLQNSDALQQAIMKQDMPRPSDIHKAALKDGFIPLELDGLVKALRGETSVAEVLRAVSPVRV